MQKFQLSVQLHNYLHCSIGFTGCCRLLQGLGWWQKEIGGEAVSGFSIRLKDGPFSLLGCLIEIFFLIFFLPPTQKEAFNMTASPHFLSVLHLPAMNQLRFVLRRKAGNSHLCIQSEKVASGRSRYTHSAIHPHLSMLASRAQMWPYTWL